MKEVYVELRNFLLQKSKSKVHHCAVWSLKLDRPKNRLTFTAFKQKGKVFSALVLSE